MKKIMKLAVAPAILMLVSITATSAFADSETNVDIEYQQPAPKHDRKIEAAAIAKVAAKIGTLRGSLEGDLIGNIISLDGLTGDRSSQLGFPIIEERSTIKNADTDLVPIV